LFDRFPDSPLGDNDGWEVFDQPAPARSAAPAGAAAGARPSSSLFGDDNDDDESPIMRARATTPTSGSTDNPADPNLPFWQKQRAERQQQQQKQQKQQKPGARKPSSGPECRTQ